MMKDASSPPTQTGDHATLPLLALAVGAFGIGTTEFSPMGLLPTIANGVHVSLASAGLLISAYAIGVMVGAPIMTLLLSSKPRRLALVFLMAIFTLGNLWSAVAPNYSTLLLARLLTSLNHGAFFGLGSLVAVSLVPRHKQASAVATMFLGLTIANIGGVPAATWMGEVLGWRLSFAAIACLGVLAMASLWFVLPKGQRGHRPDLRRELQVLTGSRVLLAMGTTVLSAGAMFTLYTFITPSLLHITHASPDFAALMLVTVGVGFSIGNVVGGKCADKSLSRTLIGFLSLLALTMFAFPWLAQTHVGAAITMLIWGMASFAVVPPLQMAVMRTAEDAPGLASSVNVGAFNLGNALGAATGSATVALNLSFGMVSVAGGVLALLALLLVFAQMSHDRGTARKAAVSV